jgi:hypothetical protein
MDRCVFVRRNDPRPSHDALAVMAKDLIHVAERPGGADSPVLEERARRFMAMVTSAEQYRADVAQYLEFDPGAGLTKAFTRFARADRELAEAGIPPAPHPAPSPATKPGHPESLWPSLGHRFAERFIHEMRAVGYAGRLGRADAESITANVGAAFISHVFRINLKPAGSASGMKSRQRRTWDRLTLEERYPNLVGSRTLDK